MKKIQVNRRRFLKDTVTGAAGIAGLAAFPANVVAASERFVTEPVKAEPEANSKSWAAPRIKFAAIGLNHGHINSQVEAVIRGGGQLVSFFAKEADLAAAFQKKYPQAKLARSEKEILEDRSIQLVVSASIPDERAPLGIRVMQHGKDFMVDKPGITTLAQLAEVRRVQKETRRIYSIMYSERLENRATVKAGELVKAGAIGKVIQTIGLGPHRMNLSTRPDWFFDKSRFGGIICDIGSHQFDQYLFFTGSTQAEVVAAQVGNFNHPQYPKFEDFGDVMLRGNGGVGYIRVDWFTPDGLKTWGDGRLTVLGTEGFIEIRKNIDIGGREGGNHLFLTDQKETRYIDCSQVPLPYGEQLVNDVLNRTETAMSQEHCLLATELALKAQQQAQPINHPK
ncbi:Gfo/Idh/MocA family protein [Adhaeribacter radiodurans]|uniref:Gfo/Idh/MocA family oxidoreductase n=1 Tax=Adhaeribacter radiodurans TaxID=2745197 RepID=A0A7L7LD11_9BACT|nr:Gfo/Idh/MocA family oxidoreductase [Adhaeribacter radiodurans]QMU30710.1 Gfo/Idh/MocA family oxidoreductase [Adhaeribacter radiodurans]